MGVDTLIQWCDHTWSPWRGCAKVSPGCANCYADALSRRNPAVLGEWGPRGRRVVNADWETPRRWDRDAAKYGLGPRVFASLCDWLEDRPELVAARARFIDLVEATPDLTWLLLTKRPERWRPAMIEAAPDRRLGPGWGARWWLAGTPPHNAWIGVSVEDQERADERIPILLETPAALRWVSYEPAIGPVDFAPWLDRLDWIVVGGESGARDKVRPFDLAWARSTIDQCRGAGVAVYVKQLGRRPYDSAARIGVDGPGSHAIALDLDHAKGGDPEEWPADLRVREFPTEVN